MSDCNQILGDGTFIRLLAILCMGHHEVVKCYICVYVICTYVMCMVWCLSSGALPTNDPDPDIYSVL